MINQTIQIHGQAYTDTEVLAYGAGQATIVGADADGLPWVQLVSIADVRITTTEDGTR